MAKTVTMSAEERQALAPDGRIPDEAVFKGVLLSGGQVAALLSQIQPQVEIKLARKRDETLAVQTELSAPFWIDVSLDGDVTIPGMEEFVARRRDAAAS